MSHVISYEHRLIFCFINFFKISQKYWQCYGMNYVPISKKKNSDIEAVTHNVTVFGDRALKERIKIKVT